MINQIFDKIGEVINPKNELDEKPDNDTDNQDEDIDDDDNDDDDDDDDVDFNEDSDDDVDFNEDSDDDVKQSNITTGLIHETNQPIDSNFNDDGDDDDTDDDDDDINYLQKFDENTKHQIISEFHPELQMHNYQEILSLAIVTRDSTNTIIDPLHRTLPFITRYEKAKILGERTKQINSGSKPLVDVDNTVIDGYIIALKEYNEKKIPFIIKRPLPNGGCEYWRFEDLEILI